MTGAVPARSAPVSVGDGCVLCGLCADACAPRALRFEHDRVAARLHLAAERCTGCLACIPLCPEGAIAPALAAVAASGPRLAAESALARCTTCDEPFVPEAMLKRVLVRLGAAEGCSGAAQGFAGMCPLCKLMAGEAAFGG